MNKKKGWTIWTDYDRERLRDLALVCSDDRQIAKIMGRSATAVSWQRRRLKIKLAGPFKLRVSRSNRPHWRQRENPSHVDRMMALVSKRRVA